MPSRPFWFLLTWGCVAWYAVVVVVVGWRGFLEIRRMIQDLEASGPLEPDSNSSEPTAL
ncbi:MAG TPA: hypothetical protein VLE22_14205 [Bryobacteraceae bacterium]|nr:hypothetical protein [Bryobacteraceae bacterium]